MVEARLRRVQLRLEGQSGTVSVLMTAGLAVGGDAAARATMATVNGLATACARDPVPFLGAAQSLSVLAGNGMPIDLPDGSGNTLLMSAAQFCPAPIAARLLQLGARPAPVNRQHWTPLQMALVGGKWDVVAVLVDAGARITPVEAGQIFMQPPEAPGEPRPARPRHETGPRPRPPWPPPRPP